MEKLISPIIIDNTNLQAWEARPYYNLSIQYNYEFRIIEPTTEWKFDSLELEKRNV